MKHKDIRRRNLSNGNSKKGGIYQMEIVKMVFKNGYGYSRKHVVIKDGRIIKAFSEKKLAEKFVEENKEKL
jgi:hypothetical protein